MSSTNKPTTATDAVVMYTGEGCITETAPGVITEFLDGKQTQIWPVLKQSFGERIYAAMYGTAEQQAMPDDSWVLIAKALAAEADALTEQIERLKCGTPVCVDQVHLGTTTHEDSGVLNIDLSEKAGLLASELWSGKLAAKLAKAEGALKLYANCFPEPGPAIYALAAINDRQCTGYCSAHRDGENPTCVTCYPR